MKILDHRQIQQKIKRLAYQIHENNYAEKEITLAGINNNGMIFARMIKDELKTISSSTLKLTQVKINPAKPLSGDIKIERPINELKKGVVIIVDDVANTGRTIFYAFKPLLEILPKKIEIAVLVDRKHKSFPVKVDYVGLSLSTTLQEDISVEIRDTDDWAVYLN
jgi:pyrimidine operon attenuation protein / uracil phosphoribosyltransferase